MGNSNTLMFKVGIADIKAELDKHKKEIESWVNSNPIKLKVQLEDSSLEQLAAKLKAMGATFGESNEEIKKMKEELNALRTILDAVMNGTSKKESAATNELRVMTKGAETAVQAMNQLSTVVNETMSRAGSGKMFPVLDRVPAIYSKLMFDIENRMTAIGSIMSKGNLPSWLDNGQGRGYLNNVFADYERLLKTMQRFKEEGFIDFHNVLALKDVFKGLESAYGPILKQATEYNKQVEKQASDVAKYEQQKAESIRKAEEKGEKERSAARAKEEKEYDKFWQKNLNEREKAAEKSAKAEENAINQNLKAEERAGAARVAAREKMEKEYEKVWQNGLKEREKAQANAEAKQAKEAELYTKNSIKNYNTWQESIRRSGVELTTIGIKIRQLEQTEARAKNAGVDASSIKARIEALKQEEQILTRIHNGEKGYGTAKEYIKSESYQRELKLAQEVNAVTNKNATEKERADNKDIKNLEIKEANQRRYNSLLNDMESILNRVSRVESKGGLLGLDTANISGRIKELQSFIDKTLNMDMRNLGDNGYISNLRAEWNTLKKSINEAAKEQERLNTAQEKSNTAAIKAQASEYKSLKKSTQEARKEAEKLVADRQKMLQDQASSLSKIMIQGRGKLDTYQYEQIRDALKAIREELRQIDAMKQRGGLSVNALLGIGAGTNNAASLISLYKQFISGKQQAAAANTRLTSTEQQLANAIRNSTDHMRGQSQVMSDLKMLATQYLGVWGAQGFLRNIIEIGGQLEMQRLSIGAILGDMAKATELFDRIKNLAIKSPFGVVELDQMTKQLSAYGFEYNELFDMTKRLADISAATGTGVDRLALALGHVRSEAALSGYTLRQFSMANIPLAKKLSEELTKVEGKLVSVADVRKRVRTKDISYEQVLKVLKDLTDEGGMFYNAQEIMSESVKARFKNLKDSMDIMYGEMAESKVGGGLKEIATLLTTLTRHWQELGAVLISGSSYWVINRVAMMAANKAMVQGNLVLGRFTATQLEMQATTGNLTRAQLLQAVATKRLAVADAEAAGAVLALSKAQLQHVANTGKVSAALNIATIATSKYSVSQLRAMAITKNMGFGATILAYLQRGWIGVTTAATAAATAVWGFVKAMWPMLAISAIVEVFMSIKRESEQFADAANYVGQAARNMMKDIDEAMKSVSKNGKPVDTEALREAVNTMKEVVENSEFYTAEQQKQVEQATTLSKKYDILLKQMKGMKAEAEWQTNNEGLIEKILVNTGKNIKINSAQNWNGQTGMYETVTSETFGSRFFNDSLQENIEKVNKSNAALQSAINLLSEYQNVIEDAIKKNDNFGLSLDGKTWQEQVRIIAESGKWDEFVSSVENAGSRFEKTASNVKKASEKVRDDWNDIVNDDVKAIRLTLMQEWNMTEDEITQFAKNNERTMRWLVDAIAKSMSKLGVAEAIIDEFKQKLLELFGVASKGKPTKTEPNEYQKQTDLAKRILGNVIRHNKNNGKNGQGVTTVKEINEIVGTGEHVKTESEVIKALKERAQNDLQSMNDIKKIYGETSSEYAKAKKKYEHSLNLAESNGISESEIRSGKYKNKTSKNTPDEAAKAVREEIRIMKEAADAYQYWREKVGDASAWSHVEEEFGDVLERIGITAKNVNDLRGNIVRLTPKINAIKDSKVRNETFKEQSKELAQLNRNDFEKTTDEFLSRTQIELDNLTRSWEMFNSVRDATGDVELAVQLSGAEYANGKNRNLADAVKEQVQKAFNDAGGQGQLDFNKLLSDKEIESMFQNAENAGGEYEKRIKSLVEAYKKWRDLQRDVLKNDTSVFLKAFENEYDRKQQFDKIATQYEENKQSLDNLLSQWQSGAVDTNGNRLGITQEQYNRAFGYLTAQANWEKFKAENDFKWVFDNIGTTSLETIKKMVKAMREYAKTTEMSEKETKAWHEAMDKLLDQESVLNPLNSIADAVKSYNDAVVNRKNAEEALRISKMSYVERKRNGIDESTVKPLQQAQDDYRQALSDEEKALLRVTKSIKSFSDSIGELGSTLSSLGSSIGGDFGDIMNGVGGMLSDISNGMNSATKLAEAIKTKGLSGTISKVSATIGIINSIVDFNKKLDSLLPSSESLYQKYADRQRKINKLQEQIADYQVEALKRQIESTNWLYTNGLSELRNQGYEKENLLKEYANSMLRPQEIYKEARSGFSKWGPAIIGAIVAVVGTVLTLGIGSVGSAALGATIAAALGTTATAAVGAALAAGAGAAIGTALRSAADSFVYSSDQTSARQNMRVQTRHKTFFRSEKTQNLEDWVRENYGKELFDSNHYDLIDIELAKQLLEDGPTLVGETRETLERLVEYAEKIREIEDNVKEYVSQMFSPLVDDATDALWDWLDNGKDMLDSFEEYASDTFKDIAKDAVKSFLKINLIDKYQDKLNDIFTAYSLGAYNEQELGLAVASVAGDIRDSYEALIPALQALGESFDRAFEAQGYDIINGGSGNSGSTSNTIKGINEQTWDLGISYWNAIRADVSINRAMIAQYFPLFYTSITSGNTKLQNIENNTAAIMRSNDEIKRTLDDVYYLFNGLKTKAWRMPMV